MFLRSNKVNDNLHFGNNPIKSNLANLETYIKTILNKSQVSVNRSGSPKQHLDQDRFYYIGDRINNLTEQSNPDAQNNDTKNLLDREANFTKKKEAEIRYKSLSELVPIKLKKEKIAPGNNWLKKNKGSVYKNRTKSHAFMNMLNSSDLQNPKNISYEQRQNHHYSHKNSRNHKKSLFEDKKDISNPYLDFSLNGNVSAACQKRSKE